jgi:dTDP-4-amino-4,6-dideoxygalactose transaminase
MKIPISTLQLPEAVETEVLAALRSGQLAQGERVRTLEDRVAALLGVDHVVAVTNGTAALVAALRSLRLPEGSEVVTSPFTFVATVNACLMAGLRVRFADIREDDFALDVAHVEAIVGPETRCLLPVHLYGQIADMPRLSAVARANGLEIVEDAAQALLAHAEDRAAGTWGMGCFSLYATKNLTSGEGGLIATDDADRADWLRSYRNQGMIERYVYGMLGENIRMTELQAAVALPQLDHYLEKIARRRRNASRLREGLRALPGLTVPEELDGRTHVWHQFTVLVSSSAGLTRDDLANRLGERGIGSGIYYPRLLGEYPHIGNDVRVDLGDTPVASRVARTCLSLPIHPGVSDEDIDEIIESVTSILVGSR